MQSEAQGASAQEARLVLVAHGGASDAHAGQLAGAAVPDLRHAVLAPAVVAEGVPALHGRRLGRGHLAEAALALQQVALACTEAMHHEISGSIALHGCCLAAVYLQEQHWWINGPSVTCKVKYHMTANCSLGSTEGFSKSILLLGQVVLFECILVSLAISAPGTYIHALHPVKKVVIWAHCQPFPQASLQVMWAHLSKA